MQIQPFPAAPRAGPPAQQTRRHDASIVEHQQVARTQEPGQFMKNPVLQGRSAVRHDQQAGFIAPDARLLGDEVRRQIVIEGISEHNETILQIYYYLPRPPLSFS